MASTSARKSKAAKAKAREKVRAYRARMRAQGLRPIQIWVPDTRSPKFAAEARRQSLLIARSEHAADDQAFIDAISVKFDE
ncbi:MAG: DUF3018 family protein [Alphaproteobacteria bacterium]|nr:DUF3018 family protein [Alphaproteobacteria bacterium]